MTEWDAAAYARISGLQAAMAAEVLALLQFEGDEQVLDVGCGNGAITSQIATRVPRGSVTGVDPSREMIAYATGHFGPGAFPNLRFDLCDARTLPFRMRSTASCRSMRCTGYPTRMPRCARSGAR